MKVWRGNSSSLDVTVPTDSETVCHKRHFTLSLSRLFRFARVCYNKAYGKNNTNPGDSSMFNRILSIVSTVLFVIRQLAKKEKRSEKTKTKPGQIEENVL